MELDPPVALPHPKALAAAASLAHALDGLGHFFGEAPAFVGVRSAGQAFLASWGAFSDALDRVEISEIRSAAERLTEAHGAMRAAEAPFFQFMWREVIKEALGDASGATARRVLRTLLGVSEGSPDHVEALWRITTRPPKRRRGKPRWEEILKRAPLGELVDGVFRPGFPAWLRTALIGRARTAEPQALEASLDLDPEMLSSDSIDQARALEMIEALEAAIEAAGLGEREAQVLDAHLWGLTATEIAEGVGLPRGAVDTALSRARKKIRASM